MTSATIPMEDYEFDAFSRLAAENGVKLEEWVLSLMDNALEDHELAKMADEAYDDYLTDKRTVPLKDLIREEGMR